MSKSWISLVGLAVAALALAACGGAGAAPQPTVISGTGGETAGKIDSFRQLLGGANNGGDPGPVSGGYREVNWDSLTDELSSPADYAPDFFNAAEAPRARGIVLVSSGKLRVSADSDNPSHTQPRFGEINPSYPDTFKALSPERLFSTIGSNVVDVTFFVPGTNKPALTRGFGAVAADVDGDATSYEYFDARGQSLGVFKVPAADGDLSFLGVAFDSPVVAKVRVTMGSAPLGPDDNPSNDVVVLDNWVYGEPQAAQ